MRHRKLPMAIAKIPVCIILLGLSLVLVFRHQMKPLPLPTTVLIGDSWARFYPMPILGKTYSYDGHTIDEICSAVSALPPTPCGRVIIIAGIASLYEGEPIEDVVADLQTLRTLCQRKFNTPHILVYDPRAMLDILEHPEYRRDQLHANRAGYRALLNTKPL